MVTSADNSAIHTGFENISFHPLPFFFFFFLPPLDTWNNDVNDTTISTSHAHSDAQRRMTSSFLFFVFFPGQKGKEPYKGEKKFEECTNKSAVSEEREIKPKQLCAAAHLAIRWGSWFRSLGTQASEHSTKDEKNSRKVLMVSANNGPAERPKSCTSWVRKRQSDTKSIVVRPFLRNVNSSHKR